MRAGGPGVRSESARDAGGELLFVSRAGAIKLLWNTTWHAVVVWALLAPFAIGLIYFVLLPIFRRAVKGQTAVPRAAEASGGGYSQK